VSIVSLDFLLEALVDVNKEKVSKEERVKSAETKLRPPTIKIQNFGEGTVNVLLLASAGVTANVTQLYWFRRVSLGVFIRH